MPKVSSCQCLLACVQACTCAGAGACSREQAGVHTAASPWARPAASPSHHQPLRHPSPHHSAQGAAPLNLNPPKPEAAAERGVPRKVVYVPACVTRIMGPARSDYEQGESNQIARGVWVQGSAGLVRAEAVGRDLDLPSLLLHPLLHCCSPHRWNRLPCSLCAREAAEPVQQGRLRGGVPRGPERQVGRLQHYSLCCCVLCGSCRQVFSCCRWLNLLSTCSSTPPRWPSLQLLRHDVQQPRLQGRGGQEGRGAGGGAAQGQRERCAAACWPALQPLSPLTARATRGSALVDSGCSTVLHASLCIIALACCYADFPAAASCPLLPLQASGPLCATPLPAWPRSSPACPTPRCGAWREGGL